MPKSLQSLIDTGTKLFLDSVDPAEVQKNLEYGAVGATSNPAIISKIVKAGGLDETIGNALAAGMDDEAISWKLADQLVKQAQQRFRPTWVSSEGNTGYVSFELDPLLEDPSMELSNQERTERYIEFGKRWSAGHENRMIKVPATDAGIDALEPLAAAGVTLNVTLIFTLEQYRAAREAIWRGAQKLDDLSTFKSVYSIFISRIDVYTKEHVSELSPAAQGQVGILNAKRAWHENVQFWRDKPTKLQQEMIFASTGTKDPDEPPWKYVKALAGSDIQTNPPETNDAIAKSDMTFEREVDKLPAEAVQKEIDEKVDVEAMHKVLMEEGVDKFAKPQLALLALIGEKRKALVG